VNVHLLDGLFLEAHEMKKDKEMYLDIVVGEMQDEETNDKEMYFDVFVGEMQDEEINVVSEMQDDYIFLKR